MSIWCRECPVCADIGWCNDHPIKERGGIGTKPVADAGGVTAADREAADAISVALLQCAPPDTDLTHFRLSVAELFTRHRLQSVAAATAAKDAEIADLKHSLMLATAFGQEEAAAHNEADKGIGRLREAAESLENYTSHRIGCELVTGGHVGNFPRCDCGLEDATAALSEAW